MPLTWRIKMRGSSLEVIMCNRQVAFVVQVDPHERMSNE
jgi:hypothetical protein